MTKPTEEEVQKLIEKYLNKMWVGDSGGIGVFRIMEILRWAARPEVQEPSSMDGDNGVGFLPTTSKEERR